mgnify:CR=1 FL=1
MFNDGLCVCVCTEMSWCSYTDDFVSQPFLDPRYFPGGCFSLCGGTVRLGLDLVIEHLVKVSCEWPREHRQIVCTCACAPHLTRRGGVMLGSYQGQLLSREHHLDMGCLPRSAAQPESPFASWVSSALLSLCNCWPTCEYFAWCCWEPGRSNFAPSLAQHPLLPFWWKLPCYEWWSY